MSFSSLADLVKNYESSGGNYSAVNPQSGAGGAYQFVPSSWHRYATAAGVDTSLYPTAQSAPPAVQDQVFQQAVQTRGLGDWTCPGCNPGLSSYVASNDVTTLPVFSGGTVPTGGLLASNTGAVDNGSAIVDPTTGEPIGGGNTLGTGVGGASGTGGYTGSGAAIMPGVGYPLDVGIQPGVLQAGSNWVSSIETSVGTAFKNATSAFFGSVTNWVERAFLIFIGIAVLVVALFGLMGVKPADVVKGASNMARA